MSPFELGDRVVIHGYAEKKHIDRTHPRWERRTTYEAIPGPPWDYSGVKADDCRREHPRGVIVGKRTLLTGTTTYTEDGAVFRSDGSVTAYLVAYHLSRKPALCFPGQIQRHLEAA